MLDRKIELEREKQYQEWLNMKDPNTAKYRTSKSMLYTTWNQYEGES